MGDCGARQLEPSSFIMLTNICNFTYLLLAALGLHCCTGFSLVAAIGGCSLVVVLRLLTEVAPLVAEYRLWVPRLQELPHVDSVVAAGGL